MPDVLGRIATPSPWEDYVPTKEDAKALLEKILLGGKPTQIPGPQWMSTLHNALDPEQSLGGVAGAAMMAVPGEAGALGSFKSTLPETVVGKTLEGGGYSVNLPTGMTPKSGLMVGKYANADPRNTVVPNVEFGAPSVEAHVAKNAKVLGSDENYLGTWVNPEDQKTYLDVSRRFAPSQIRPATKFGERTGQMAGFNAGTGETFPIGNWEEFVNSPEYAQRLQEMGIEGGEYLSMHPTRNWWDMPDMTRVYGEENKPQMAGFTATTAPNTAPRANLQTMSEYMRRHIKGEDIIQPDWRVPEGTMSRNAGTQIGMETGRRANLLKSAAGDLDALQRNKVREEAKAIMGDPNAVVIDRHQVRLTEDPSRGIFASTQEGSAVGKNYDTIKAAISREALKQGSTPRDFSAEVWTGIREQLKSSGDLYGTKFRGSAIPGESRSYNDEFNALVADKAKHLGIDVPEMERRLGSGDATLLGWLLATPLGAKLYSMSTQQTPVPPLESRPGS